MPIETSTSVRRRKRRVGVACDFCRRRKLGCDNAKPRCESCDSYGKDCTYTERTKQPRPSNSRIKSLEEENARLRASLLSPTSPASQASHIEVQIDHGDRSDTARSLNNGADPEEPQLRPRYRARPIPSSPLAHNYRTTASTQETRFHGPSSAIFDQETPANSQKLNRSSAVGSYAKSLLLAEATRQRQHELINLMSSRFDFDGVGQHAGMQLLSSFWNRQHSSGSIVYRPAFMRDMACNGRYFSKLLLNAMLFAASKDSSEPGGPCNATNDGIEGRSFRKKAEDILHEANSWALFTSEVTTIQALLILSDALFTWCDERSLSWHYSGIAINMIIDLGIHTEDSSPSSTRNWSLEDFEVHRRLFWAAFVLDKVQSLYQGRPARLRDIDNRVPISFLDEIDELDPFNTLTYSTTPRQLCVPTHSVSTFEHLCKLTIIMDRLLSKLYTEKSFTEDSEDLLHTSDSISAQLRKWRVALPSCLSIEPDNPGDNPVLPHTLSLMSMFYSMVILLHRPFVSEGHLQSVSSDRASDSFAACVSSALSINHILRLYRKHFCMKTCPYFVSYATYVSATIHARIAAQRSQGSEAHKCLRNCLEILSEQQVKCRAPRRAMAALLSLIKRLKVNVSAVSDDAGLISPRPEPQEPDQGVQSSAQHGDLPSLHSMQNDSVPASTHANEQLEHLHFVPMDFDIDAVIKSFDFGQSELTQPSSVPTSLTGNSIPTSGQTTEHGHPAGTHLEETLLSSAAIPSLDVLFGFDAPFNDYGLSGNTLEDFSAMFQA